MGILVTCRPVGNTSDQMRRVRCHSLSLLRREHPEASDSKLRVDLLRFDVRLDREVLAWIAAVLRKDEVLACVPLPDRRLDEHRREEHVVRLPAVTLIGDPG